MPSSNPSARNPERRAQHDPEQQHIAQAWPRQIARRTQQRVGCAHHDGGEGDVLGVIEHPAVPDAADGKQRGGDQARARAGDQTRRRPGGGDAADAEEGAEEMADVIDVERHCLGDERRHDVEQSAVEIEILEREQRGDR